MAPIWPKLWRRLQEYSRTGATDLAGFVAFVAAKGERVDLLDTVDETGLEDLIVVDGDVVRFLVDVRARSVL